MNCPKCQQSVAPDARFCNACGEALAAAAPADTAPPAAVPTPSPALPAFPDLMQRVKNILLTPQTEWPVIAGEPTLPGQLFTGYVVPLVALAAVVTFIHLSVIGISVPFAGTFRTPLIGGLITAVYRVVFGIIGVFLIGLIIDGLAPTFGGSRDQRQALKVSAYSLTPAFVGAVLGLSPILASLLQLAAGCYGIYVLYLGLPVLMRAPQERAVGYTATVVICTLLMGVVLSVVGVGLGLANHPWG